MSYYNARYYDPGIGQFTHADTIVPDPTLGIDFNRYAYVRNSPTRYVDPTGHCSEYREDTGDCVFYLSDTTFISHENGSATVHTTNENYAQNVIESCGGCSTWSHQGGTMTCPPGASAALRCGHIDGPSVSPPNPVGWWLDNDEEIADAASHTGTAAGGLELTFIACSGMIVTIPKCGPGAAGAAAVGTTASATEFAAGVTSLDAGHMFWGGLGVSTLGLSGAVRTIDPDGVVALPREAKDGVEIFFTEWIPKGFHWSADVIGSLWD